MTHRGPTAVALLSLLLALAALPQAVAAAELRVAVASNFKAAARTLAAQFEARTGQQVSLLFGSSGKHFAQITNGAPVDAFLSADSQRVVRLEEAGRTVSGTRFVYAIGKLTLWSAKESFVDDAGKVLERAEFVHLAIANPRLAPYGQAAEQVLESLGLAEKLASKLVRAENIEQAMQFVTSGNAELGFLAHSQLTTSTWGNEGSQWQVPQALYAPILQEAALIQDVPAAREFFAFLKSEEARAVIRNHGYDTP